MGTGDAAHPARSVFINVLLARPQSLDHPAPHPALLNVFFFFIAVEFTLYLNLFCKLKRNACGNVGKK